MTSFEDDWDSGEENFTLEETLSRARFMASSCLLGPIGVSGEERQTEKDRGGDAQLQWRTHKVIINYSSETTFFP